MNLVLSSIHPNKPPAVLGPFIAVCLDHEALRENSAGPVLAVHERHQWVLNGERYIRIDATTAVSVHFENRDGTQARRVLGVFTRFSLVDGLAYGDDDIVAHLDRHNEWFCYDLAERWPLMLLRKVKSER